VLENVPLNKHVLSEWLNAGIFEKGQLEPSIEGVPQGGAISPTIFNYVLNGVEPEIMKTGGFPIRYADDLAVFTKTQEEAEKAKEVIISFLKPRGLELNEGKSVIVPIEKGTDFLGFHIREYKDISRTKNPKMKFKQGIVLTKPATKAVENFRQKVKLNPVLRG
jgi:RNA-directed DNA polymerase